MNKATYTGYLPVPTPDFTRDPPSIVRRVGSDGPVLDILHNDITCNFNAAPIADNGVSRTGEVAAGTTIEFHWPGWPHSGPIMTYMAKCEPDCGSFTGWGTKSWFKIDEKGYNASWGGWATQYLYDQKNVWVSTVPACLAPGEYLIRHEIIALSDCKTVGKCQFYPSCAQLKVTGTGTVTPPNLVSFPGAYGQKDPGIFWDTNKQLPADYVVPGPAVFKC